MISSRLETQIGHDNSHYTEVKHLNKKHETRFILLSFDKLCRILFFKIKKAENILEKVESEEFQK